MIKQRLVLLLPVISYCFICFTPCGATTPAPKEGSPTPIAAPHPPGALEKGEAPKEPTHHEQGAVIPGLTKEQIAMLHHLAKVLKSPEYTSSKRYTGIEVDPFSAPESELVAELGGHAKTAKRRPGIAVSMLKTQSQSQEYQFACTDNVCSTAFVVGLPAGGHAQTQHGATKVVITNAFVAHATQYGASGGRAVLAHPYAPHHLEPLEELVKREGATRAMQMLPPALTREFPAGSSWETGWTPLMLLADRTYQLRFLQPYLGEPLISRGSSGPAVRNPEVPQLDETQLTALATQLTQQLVARNFKMFDLKPENVLYRAGATANAAVFTWIDFETPCWTYVWLKCVPGFTLPWTGEKKSACSNTFAAYGYRLKEKVALGLSRVANAQAIINVVYFMSRWDHALAERALDQWVKVPEVQERDPAWKAAVEAAVNDFMDDRDPHALQQWGAYRMWHPK